MATQRKASPPVTAAMAGHIRYLRYTQHLYQHQIAALVGVNSARVSEVLKGRRFPDEPPKQGSFAF